MDCIFCKIVAGEIPAYKVYEDEKFLAFLDIRPLTRGNSLVVPKDHHRWVYDVPDFGDYFEVAKRVALASQRAFHAEWVCFLTMGLEVPHAHIRVIPRYSDDLHEELITIDIHEQFSDEEMNNIADMIKDALI